MSGFNLKRVSCTRVSSSGSWWKSSSASHWATVSINHSTERRKLVQQTHCSVEVFKASLQFIIVLQCINHSR